MSQELNVNLNSFQQMVRSTVLFKFKYLIFHIITKVLNIESNALGIHF